MVDETFGAMFRSLENHFSDEDDPRKSPVTVVREEVGIGGECTCGSVISEPAVRRYQVPNDR